MPGMFGRPDGRFGSEGMLGRDGTLGSDGIAGMDGSDGTLGIFGIDGRPNRCNDAAGPSDGGWNTTEPSAARCASPACTATLPGSPPEPDAAARCTGAPAVVPAVLPAGVAAGAPTDR